MYTDPLTLFPYCHSHPVNKVLIINSTHCQLVWIPGDTVQPHSQSPFTINRHHQWCFCNTLIIVGQVSLSYWATLEKAKCTDIILPDIIYYFGHMIRTEIGVCPDYH